MIRTRKWVRTLYGPEINIILRLIAILDPEISGVYLLS
jgi:hypothetical protein